MLARNPSRKCSLAVIAAGLLVTCLLILNRSYLEQFTITEQQQQQSRTLLEQSRSPQLPPPPCPDPVIVERVEVECPVCPTSRDCPTCLQQSSSHCPPELLREPANCSADALFPELMKDRQRVLKERCQHVPSGTATGTAMEKFYLDRLGPDGLVWCPIYKGASSSTNSHFCPLYYPQSTCSKPSAALWRKPDYKWSKAPKSTPTLLIVRHPFERLFSAYRDKIQAPRDGNGFIQPAMKKVSFTHRFIAPEFFGKRQSLIDAAVKTAAKQMKEHPVERGQYVYIAGSTNPYLNPLSATFEEFVRAVTMGQFENEHWRQVSKYCAPCTEHYDYILKVENYKCEFPQFLRELGSTESILNRMDLEKRINVNKGRSMSDRTDFYEYYSTLPDNLLDALHEWYRADCDLFDYDCEKTLCEIRDWKRTHT